MIISDLRKADYQLPESVKNINLKQKLNSYDESKHLLHIKALVDEYFSKREKTPFTPKQLVEEKKWQEVGIKPDGLSYQDIDSKIRQGRPFDTYAWIPNDKIYGNSQHNRTDTINFTNTFRHLDFRGGLFWQAMNITLVVYYDDDGSYKFVTVIGNHCTVKSIVVCGVGAPVFARVISYGKNTSLEEIRKLGAQIHHTDSDRRTNQGAQDRLVSGARAGEEQYEDTMKVLVDMGFNIKDQVKKNGKDLLTISSPQSLMGIIKEYDYQIVKDNVQLIRDNYPNATRILTGGLSVLTTIRYYFGENKANRISKDDFKKWFDNWSSTNDQEDIFPNSGTQKDVMVPVLDMIKSINRYSKKHMNRKQGLITKKDIATHIPEKKLENVSI